MFCMQTIHMAIHCACICLVGCEWPDLRLLVHYYSVLKKMFKKSKGDAGGESRGEEEKMQVVA